MKRIPLFVFLVLCSLTATVALSDETSPMVPGIMGRRNPDQRDRALSEWGAGGGDATVMRALRWLKTMQNADGSWGTSSQFKTALTGMAVLVYLAHNEIPAPDTEFGPTSERGIKYLVESLGSGEFFREKDGNNYSHPIGVYALGEAYAMTKDQHVKSAVKRAIRPIIRGQNLLNGWDYGMAKTVRTDCSYSGWCAQAVKAVHSSGASVPGLDECYERTKHAFDYVYRGDGQFCYQSENGGRPIGHPAETSIAVFCMQLLEQHEDPKVKAAMHYLEACSYDFARWEEQPWEDSRENPSPVYYWYYLTQAKFQAGGEIFRDWNKLFLPELMRRQLVIRGEGGASGYRDIQGKYRDIGWWDSPSRNESFRTNCGGLPCTWYRDGTAVEGSTSIDCRIMDTCLCALQLMVFYRFVPTSEIVEKPIVEKINGTQIKGIPRKIKVKHHNND